MALAPRAGSGSGSPPIAGQQTIVDMTRDLDRSTIIKDTFINRTSFNATTYAKEFGALQGFLRGARIKVTYFANAPYGADRMSDAIDVSTVRNSIHTDYTCITDMELTLTEQGLSSSFDNVTNETKITGEAILYPGIQPHLGDVFIFVLNDGKIGQFQISNVERATWRNGSTHKVSFFLARFATNESAQLLVDSASRILYFDKNTFLGDATTLLVEESYVYLTTLRNMRHILINNYYMTFFDSVMSSIVNYDGTYDPYLVKYLMGKVSITESNKRPLQLYPSLMNYERSLWHRLEDPFTNNVVGLSSSFNHVRYTPSRLSAGITSLINKVMVTIDPVLINPVTEEIPSNPQSTNNQYIHVGSSVINIGPRDSNLLFIDSHVGYVLTGKFYDGNLALMTNLEKLVYEAITKKVVTNIKAFIELHLNTYANLSTADKFYTIPLYLYLIDVAIENITKTDAKL